MFIDNNTGKLYSRKEIINLFPNVSLPSKWTSVTLNFLKISEVIVEERPEVNNPFQKAVLQDPVKNQEGTWVRSWGIENIYTSDEFNTQEQYEAHHLQLLEDNLSLSVREQRNDLLTSSDWTQAADAPVDKAAWATYRQALRDITTHANFPNLEEADWPVAP